MFEFNTPPKRTSISLTPLIDVVFILLLFFMLATDFDKLRSLKLSRDSAAPVAQLNHSTRVVVASSDGFRIDNEVVDSTGLHSILQSAVEKNPDHAVKLQTLPGTTVQFLVNAIAVARNAGISQVSIDTIALPD